MRVLSALLVAWIILEDLAEFAKREPARVIILTILLGLIIRWATVLVTLGPQ